VQLKSLKSALLQPKVKYLGHVVGRDEVGTDPDKVHAVDNRVAPRDLTGLQAFLRLVRYYWLTAERVYWQQTHAEQQAFDHSKGCLVWAPILAYRDPTKEYILYTDASNHNAGAVLSQVQDGQEVVIAYYSKAPSTAEKNYCTTRKELLTVIKAVKHFRPYLYGKMPCL